MTQKNTLPFIFGEVLYDRFPDGSAVLGGAPFNVAWHLQAFDQTPVLVSRIGNDSLGRNIRAAMETWGMSTAGLQLDSEHPTGTVEVTFNDGEPSYDIVEGRAWDYISAERLPPNPPSLLYHGSLALRNEVSAAALSALKQRTPETLFLDVNLRPPWYDAEKLKTLLDGAHWVKLNEDELRILQPGGSALEELAAEFRRRYDIETLILTRGSEGAELITQTDRTHAVAPEEDIAVVDTVGAGDAFTSVTILGSLRDWPVDTTLERAQAFASAIVSVRGATVQDTAFYRPFKRAWGLSG